MQGEAKRTIRNADAAAQILPTPLSLPGVEPLSYAITAVDLSATTWVRDPLRPVGPQPALSSESQYDSQRICMFTQQRLFAFTNMRANETGKTFSHG